MFNFKLGFFAFPPFWFDCILIFVLSYTFYFIWFIFENRKISLKLMSLKFKFWIICKIWREFYEQIDDRSGRRKQMTNTNCTQWIGQIHQIQKNQMLERKQQLWIMNRCKVMKFFSYLNPLKRDIRTEQRIIWSFHLFPKIRSMILEKEFNSTLNASLAIARLKIYVSLTSKL